MSAAAAPAELRPWRREFRPDAAVGPSFGLRACGADQLQSCPPPPRCPIRAHPTSDRALDVVHVVRIRARLCAKRPSAQRLLRAPLEPCRARLAKMPCADPAGPDADLSAPPLHADPRAPASSSCHIPSHHKLHGRAHSRAAPYCASRRRPTLGRMASCTAPLRRAALSHPEVRILRLSPRALRRRLPAPPPRVPHPFTGLVHRPAAPRPAAARRCAHVTVVAGAVACQAQVPNGLCTACARQARVPTSRARLLAEPSNDTPWHCSKGGA